MGQIGQTIGGLVGIGQNPGVNTFSAGDYGQDYSSLISQQQGNLNAVNANQTALAGQLGNIANGQGPNPAQAMLNQSTSANVANQAAMQAGQRGASQNVGMIARNAGQQGMQAQQQAAGQGATMQANQQLGALGQQAGVYGQQGQQAVQGMGAYEAAINAANNINAGSAESRAKYGQGFGGGLLTGIGSMLAEGGEVEPKHFDQGGEAGGSSFVGQFLNSMNSGMSQSQGKAGPQGHGIISGFFRNMGSLNKSQGNPMQGSQNLGSSSSYDQNLTPFGNSLANNPGMAAGDAGYAGADAGAGSAAAIDAGAADTGAGSALAELAAAKGGRVPAKVPAMVSPGEHRIPKTEVKKVAEGKVNPFRVGETFPGKPKTKGNSYSNDVIRKNLPAGDVIIPNSVMQSKDPVKGAADFVRDVISKKRKRA